MIKITKEQAKELGNIHIEGLTTIASLCLGKCGISDDDQAMGMAVKLFLQARGVERQFDKFKDEERLERDWDEALVENKRLASEKEDALSRERMRLGLGLDPGLPPLRP